MLDVAGRPSVGGGRRVDLNIPAVLGLSRDDQLSDSLALGEATLRREKEDAEATDVVRRLLFAGLSGARVPGCLTLRL
jgi:hypothetical protein